MVCAISKRIRATLEPRKDDKILLHSVLGEHETSLASLESNEHFRFVVGAIKQVKKCLPHGFDLDIRTEMSHQMGLGTSAAVTVATLAALDGCLGHPLIPEKLLERGIKVIRHVQNGVGSGADVAASSYGGCLQYAADPFVVQRLDALPELTVLYSGHKLPTAQVIAFVETKIKKHPDMYAAIDALIGQATTNAFHAAKEANWKRVGEMMNINQGLMDAMGVNDEKLSELVYSLRKDPNIMGSKISGSGLGDCVVGLGKSMRRDWNVPSVALVAEAQGATVERIEA